MIKRGTIIKTPFAFLKVDEMRGNWIRFKYWDKHKKQWRMRGYVENREKIESKIESGEYPIVENFYGKEE